VSFYRGNLVGVEDNFSRLSGCLEAAGFRHVPGAAVAAIGTAGLCAWTSGQADIARERIAQAIAFARDSKNPYDLAVARILESWLYRWLREPQRAEAAATQISTIVEEHGFPYVRNLNLTMLGWARAQLGSAGEGVALIRQGVAGSVEAGVRLTITDQLTGLAEAQALDGKTDDALITIEDAPRANPEELVFRANILICRGELRLRLGQTELAEADFREAIALAQKISAKAWELRATTSLARLLAKQGKPDEARAMLVEIYNWFTEGFDTADLKDAKVLLDELSR
jgi:tetratricopeptide (TPR) repeat protein